MDFLRQDIAPEELCCRPGAPPSTDPNSETEGGEGQEGGAVSDVDLDLAGRR